MENYEAVRKALLANRANTLALLGCLRETLEERPFREAEDALAGSRAMALTTQTPHALYAMPVEVPGRWRPSRCLKSKAPMPAACPPMAPGAPALPMPRTSMAARTSRWLIPPPPNFPISPWTICCIPLKRPRGPG